MNRGTRRRPRTGYTPGTVTLGELHNRHYDRPKSRPVVLVRPENDGWWCITFTTRPVEHATGTTRPAIPDAHLANLRSGCHIRDRQLRWVKTDTLHYPMGQAHGDLIRTAATWVEDLTPDDCLELLTRAAA